MAIHEQVLTQQSLLDFFAQMKEEDRKKQEKEGMIAEYKYKMELEKKEREKEQQKRKEEEQKRKEEEQKLKEEQQKREKSDYIIQLIKQGYTVDDLNKKRIKNLQLYSFNKIKEENSSRSKKTLSPFN